MQEAATLKEVFGWLEALTNHWQDNEFVFGGDRGCIEFLSHKSEPMSALNKPVYLICVP